MIFKREKCCKIEPSHGPQYCLEHTLYTVKVARQIAFNTSFFCVSHLFYLRQPHSYEYDNFWIKSLLKTAMTPFLELKRKMLSWIVLILRTAQVTSPFCSASKSCSVSHKMNHFDPGSQISLAEKITFLDYREHRARYESLLVTQVHFNHKISSQFSQRGDSKWTW